MGTYYTGLNLEPAWLTTCLSCGDNWYRDRYGNCRRLSSWYWWGRWVFAGLAVLTIIIVFFYLLYVSVTSLVTAPND
jgi:4-amino-4-deoxy-L-arabinose transferase-like glycosyltransferase